MFVEGGCNDKQGVSAWGFKEGLKQSVMQAMFEEGMVLSKATE